MTNTTLKGLQKYCDKKLELCNLKLNSLTKRDMDSDTNAAIDVRNKQIHVSSKFIQTKKITLREKLSILHHELGHLISFNTQSHTYHAEIHRSVNFYFYDSSYDHRAEFEADIYQLKFNSTLLVCVKQKIKSLKDYSSLKEIGVDCQSHPSTLNRIKNLISFYKQENMQIRHTKKYKDTLKRVKNYLMKQNIRGILC